MAAKKQKPSQEERNKLARAAVDARRGMNPLAAALASAGVVGKDAVEAVKKQRIAEADARLAAVSPRRTSLAEGPRGETAEQAILRLTTWSVDAGVPAPRRSPMASEDEVEAVARALGAPLPPSFRRFWTHTGDLEIAGEAITFTTTRVGKLVEEARSLGEMLPRLRRVPDFFDPGAPAPVLIVGTRDSGAGVGYYCVPLAKADQRGEAPVFFALRDEYDFERIAGDCDEWIAVVTNDWIESQSGS